MSMEQNLKEIMNKDRAIKKVESIMERIKGQQVTRVKTIWHDLEHLRDILKGTA